MNIRDKALQFATAAHAGQKRKDGQDYITHPIAVAKIAVALAKNYFGLTSENQLDDIYVVSLLHDVAEDTSVTLEDIKNEFGIYISKAVGKLTRTKETYFEFIMAIDQHNDIAPRIVKLADLQHNLSDLQEGSLKDKYRFAEHFLLTNY